MKKIFLIIAMVSVLVCLFTISAFATEINGVFYTLDNDGTATVNTKNQTATTVDVTIPSEVTYDGVTYKVDRLDERAFSGNKNVQIIRILSEHITIIPTGLFTNTYDGALEKVFIDFSKITSIGGYGLNNSAERNDRTPSSCKETFAFYDAKAYIVDGSEVKITSPDFSSCTNFGDACFQACAKFDKVIISEITTSIEQQCFRRSTMTALEIHAKSIAKIKMFSFSECPNLASIKVFSRNITEYGGSAFSSCPNVTEVYIDLSNCINVGGSAFQVGNTRYDGGNTKTQWYNLDGQKIVDLSNVKKIEGNAFASSNLGSAEIIWPIALDSLGDQAFRRCNIKSMIYLNASEGKTISAPFWCFNGNAPTLIIYGKGVTNVSNAFEAECTAIFLADSITFGNDAKFDKANSTLYCKATVDSSKYSKGTVINFTSGTVDYFGVCGLIAKLTTSDGDVTIDKTTHKYNLVDYDNTYCPINAMGNYECEKCKDEKQVPNEGTNPVKDGHSYDTLKSVIYENGYLSNGEKTMVCQCTLELTETVNAIFKFNGYSTNREQNAICVGFSVDQDLLKEYNTVNTPLQFGAVASAKTENILSVADGKVTGSTNTVVAEIKEDYSSFDFVLSGFNSTQNELALVVCAYVYDGENVSFMQANLTQDPPTITLQTVIDAGKKYE